MFFNLFLEVSQDITMELVSKELNHLEAILHVYARSLNFIKQIKNLFVIILQKEN